MRKYSTRKKRSNRIFVCLGIAVTIGLLIVYALWIEPNRYVVTKHRLDQPHSSIGSTLKIVQISDLHLKQLNRRAQRIAEQVNHLKPDLIVFTGDSIDRAEQLRGFAQFLALLDKQVAKYAIVGNWEYWAGVDLALLKKAYATFNGHLLINESVIHQYRNHSILITGIDDIVSQPNLAKSLQDVSPQAYHVLLAHSPAYRDSFSNPELQILKKFKPQLMLAGHTHGGQLAFWGFAPLRPPGSGQYVSGWYRDGIVPLYVSRGLGVSVLPMRVGAVPEISYFELNEGSFPNLP
jgi:predicted MPP superfamily phosphohydrolase